MIAIERPAVPTHPDTPFSSRTGGGELVYLVAPSGHPNYGQKFILRAWLRHLARVRPDADVVVDCHTPRQTSALLSECHPRVTFVDTVWRICFETAHQDAPDAMDSAAKVVADPHKLPTLASRIDLLCRAQVIHLVGGGYINTEWSHHLALLATITAGAQRSGGRAVATGQCLALLGSDDRITLLRQLHTQFNLFDTRDAPSRDVLVGSGGPESFTGDDSWLGISDPAVYNPRSPAAMRPYVFCLQSDLMDDFGGGRGSDGLLAAVSTLINRWDIRGNEVAVIEALPGADQVIYDRIVHMLPGAMRVPFNELWRRGLPARGGQMWISTRFHAHLLAAAAGASGLALSGRHDYYPTKHRSLIDAGSRWQISDLAGLPANPPRAGGFPAQTAYRLQQRKALLADQIYPPHWPYKILRRLRGPGAAPRR